VSRTRLKPERGSDDLYSVTVKEDLIRDALVKCASEDLDRVLTTIEAYRTCVATAEKLRRSPSMRDHRTQALNCAGHCEATLSDYVATGRLPQISFPHAESGSAHLRLSIRW
jgi:hypothetical protein